MAQGRNLRLRLFLEGVEVPVISSNVNVTANAPASCSIQVIATDKILSLLPRTVVHLFYYDFVEMGNVAIDQKRKSDDIADRDWINSKYKLLFMGELVTIKFSKMFGQRAVVLECADFSNYWDTTFQYNFGGSLFGGRRQAAFIGANSTFFTSPLGHGIGTVSRLLNGRSVNYPELKGLLAGVVRMLEAIGGSYYGTNTFRGANDFTSIAELRLKVLQQITAAEKDTTTAKLFARKAFNLWMNRKTQSLGKLVSFRGLVKTMFSFIFHEVYPCPVARYIPASSAKKRVNYRVGLDKSGKFSGLYDQIQNTNELVVFAKENMLNWRKKRPEDVNAASKAATSYVRSWIAAERSMKELFGTVTAISPPKDVVSNVLAAHTEMGVIRSLSVRNGRITANWYNQQGDNFGTLDQNYTTILGIYDTIKSYLEKAMGVKIKRAGSKTVNYQSRVNNQIFRPDIWFSSPPRSNVLFPELYSQFDFSRQYLREVSRLELQTHNEILGKHALFNGRYYAPNVEDVRRGVKLSSRRFAKLIMEHELLTGIIPMFENMSEVNIFAMRGGKVTKSGAKIGFAQRAVNFQYFKYRFDSRAMTASGGFNPQFIPGFPSLIVDRHMDHYLLWLSSLEVGEQTKLLGITAEDPPTRAELLQHMVGPQYLGVCNALVHSVSQDGGGTQYQFSHARVHRESTEYLGVDKAEGYKTVGDSRKTSVVAAPVIIPPIKGMVGPKGGVIAKVTDVSKAWKGKTIKLFGQQNSKVVIGDWYPHWFFQGMSVDPGSQLLIGAYEVQEGYVRRHKATIDFPIEKAIQPSWIWDGWATPKVGETYTQMFGITDITDITGYGVTNVNPNDAEFFIDRDEEEALRNQRRATVSNFQRQSAAVSEDERSQAIDAASKFQVIMLLSEKEKTIENSVDYLVRSYSFVKINNLDVGDYLRSFGWRPVATMVEILGSTGLTIKEKEVLKDRMVRQKFLHSKGKKTVYTDEDGVKTVLQETKPVYKTKWVKKKLPSKVYEVEGDEGFHSRAFGDVEDLFGLVSPTVRTVLGLDKADRRKVASRMDVRKKRRDAVMAYVEELTGSRGLIG